MSKGGDISISNIEIYFPFQHLKFIKTIILLRTQVSLKDIDYNVLELFTFIKAQRNIHLTEL